MKLYLYCSYKFSPVGFDIGFVDSSDNSKDYFSMKKGVSESLIKNLFITGGLKSACGQISENKWLVLFKEVDDFKNFAVEFDEFSEYQLALKKIQTLQKNESLAQKIETMMVIDKTIPDFGYTVDKNAFNFFVQELRNDSGILESNSTEDSEKLFIECRSDKTKEHIANQLGLLPNCFENPSEYNSNSDYRIYVYDKKKELKLKLRQSKGILEILGDWAESLWEKWLNLLKRILQTVTKHPILSVIVFLGLVACVLGFLHN